MGEKTFIICCGIAGGIVAEFFGGWSDSMTTLVIFMAIDYITGLIVAGVFHKSKKSRTGKLESRAGFKGLCRKGAIMMIVIVACRLDFEAHTHFIRDATIIAFITNETLSIIENAGLMGIPIPKVIQRGVEMLTNQEKKKEAG